MKKHKSSKCPHMKYISGFSNPVLFFLGSKYLKNSILPMLNVICIETTEIGGNHCLVKFN